MLRIAASFLLGTSNPDGRSGVHGRRQYAGRGAVALVLLASMAALVSCKGALAPPETHRTDALLRSVYPPIVYGPTTNAVDIYVDDSKSMQGFVAPQPPPRQSNYRRLISEMWNSAAESHLDWTTRKFSSPDTANGLYPQNEVESQAFYMAQDTRLTVIVQKIASGLASRPARAAILISDLVQSEPKKDSVDLATALEQLAELHPQMELLGYRSDFSGDYKPERGGAEKIRNMKKSQDVEGQGRPFYVVLIAPNPDTLKNLRKYLISGLDVQKEVFDPTAAPVAIDAVALTADPKGHPAWDSLSRSVDSKRVPNQVHTVFQLVNAPSSATVTLPLTIKYRATIPIREVGSLGLEAYQAQGAGNEANPVPVAFTGRVDDAKASMMLELTLPKPAQRSWDTYLLRVRPGDANLGVPQWISSWNTDDDTDPSHGNQTYRLKVLAETMVRNITEKEVCAEWVLNVGGVN